MNDIVKIAIEEIENPTFELTKQYLEVNSIMAVDGNYCVDRINESERSFDVYFKIDNEKYFIAFQIGRESKKIEWVFMENGNHCYLTATSEKYSLSELAEMTSLRYTSGWSKGDARKSGKSLCDFSRINFDFLESSSYDTIDAINLLLDKISIDKNGIKRLVETCNAYIGIEKYQYISANAGLHLDCKTMQRLIEFGLEVDIDTYISGNEINC